LTYLRTPGLAIETITIPRSIENPERVNVGRPADGGQFDGLLR